MSVYTFNLTGENSIFRGDNVSFDLPVTGHNLTGAVFESSIVRNFDKSVIETGFSHSFSNTGTGFVTLGLSESLTSGIDYATSSFKSFIFPSGASPDLLSTGIVNVVL